MTVASSVGWIFAHSFQSTARKSTNASSTQHEGICSFKMDPFSDLKKPVLQKAFLDDNSAHF